MVRRAGGVSPTNGGCSDRGTVRRTPFQVIMEEASIDGTGRRFAFAGGSLGTPWITLGSFMNVGSSFAGTIDSLAQEDS
jgi:hypothetical protein